jgi:DNA-binding CsgD family transcriptional regulator
MSSVTAVALPAGAACIDFTEAPSGPEVGPLSRECARCAPYLRERGDAVAVDLRGALAALLAGSDVPCQVRDEISASWRRSAESGLKPDQFEVPFDPDVDADGLLSRAARPVLQQLALDLSGAPVAVLLANERGQVLDRPVADAWLRARLDRLLLAPGFVYAEDLVGTNGMGTALAQRSAAAVEGQEHFADALTTVACAAAPIADPRDGRILGVIDLTSLAGDASALMLPLARRAAREIEQRLVDDAGVSERLVLQRFLRDRRRAKGPLVFITQRSMITNAAADRLVEAGDESLLRACASRLLSGKRDDASRVVLSCGTPVTIRWEPLIDGGSQLGAVLRLKPIAAAGSAPRRAGDRHPTFGWESLTGTERSVIELVAQGLTNREAGERLFLSHHTVGYHLRSIFWKLGVHSRVELARLAMGHDTERDPDKPALVAVGAG